MEQIFILGSGGFAKEVYALIRKAGHYHVPAFVDLEGNGEIRMGDRAVPVITEDDLWAYSKKAALAIGVGFPFLRRKLAERFSEAFVFPNIVHPAVSGDFENISMGVGNIILAGCVFTTAIKVGSFNLFNMSCTIGHDAVIGDYNVINPTANISGGVQIGNGNLIGVNATILQYKHIGNNVTVGASALVTKDIADDVTVVGIPARIFQK